MTLAEAQARLEGWDFLRTHRSWLVSPGRVRSLTAEGSGDYGLELEGGVTAPLSRRYPDAARRLREPPA
jgi:DNA-binding LytR/AlgR family response regulator